MVTTIASKLFTFAEYLAYDDGTDTHYELVDGKLLEMPPSIRLHRRIAKFLEACFEREIARLRQEREVGRGEVGVCTKKQNGKDTVRQPDVVVFNRELASDLNEVDVLKTAPLLAIEIVSKGPNNRKRDYELKRQEYQSLGIPEYWIVDPEKQKVTILVLDEVAKFYEQQEYRGSAQISSFTFPELILTVDQVLGVAK